MTLALDLVHLTKLSQRCSETTAKRALKSGGLLKWLSRDETAAKRGYTTRSYIDALEDGLRPLYKEADIFQQDGTRIHTSVEAKRWFLRHKVTLIAPNSPDVAIT